RSWWRRSSRYGSGTSRLRPSNPYGRRPDGRSGLASARDDGHIRLMTFDAREETSMTSTLPVSNLSPAQHAARLRNTVVGWRRHLHMHPELSYHEEQTAQFVYDTVRAMGGFELSRPTKTSVVARLRGLHDGPVLAVR